MVPFRRIRQVAALAILLAGLTTQMTPASAAALPQTGGQAGTAAVSHAQAGSAATRSGRSRSREADVIRPRIKPVHGFGLTRRPRLRYAGRGRAVGSAAATRAAAARAALASTTVLDTCSGLIQPDTVYPCTTPSGTGTDTFTLSLTSTTDLLLIRVLDTAGDALPLTLSAPGGGSVSCQQSGIDQIAQCPASQAGTYTLQVQNGGGSYTLAYRPLLSDPSCTVANPSFASPMLTSSLAAGGVGACYTLAMTAGQILHDNSTALNQGLLVTVYDSTGAQICFDDQGDCPLGGTGPYFVQVDAVQADAVTYHLELNNINQPQGCLPGPQLTYGSAPGAKSVNRCRTLTVGAAGQYQVYAVSPQDGIPSSTLYTPNGTVACTNTYSSTAPTCQLAAGTYDLVADPYPGSRAQVGAVFIAADESRGCQATGDTDFASGPATGTFTGVGEEICLTLPVSAGPAVYLFNQPTADGTSPQLEVVDATGAQVCQSNGFVFSNCALTGTAPFRIILSGQQANGGYRVLAQASRSTTGCATWPQSGFGGSFGATVKLAGATDAACLSIPAGQHSTGEMIDYSNLANSVDAAIYVNDPAGNNVCIGASTAICSYSPGVTYTALLISGTGQFEVICRATGSTSYQLIVTALDYQGIVITAHVDAWRVRTASGWTPQCRTHQLSGTTGWAPIRVKMSEAAVGYCAVLSVQANQETTIYSPSSTNTGVGQPFVMLESAAGWSGNQDLCSTGQPYVACDVLLNTPPGKYVLLVFPYQMPLPTVFTFQGVCTLGCPGGPANPVITSVSPATGPAGSVNKLIVGGTHLNLGVQVDLASNANVVAQATPVSLNSGGTALTVLLNTQGVTPGIYDVVQDGVGYTVGVPSPGYLPGAYQVTAGPLK